MSDYRTMTMVLGAPRSGTTWLAKIFDSHPDVLYRHEPDLVDIHDDVPHICLDGEEPLHASITRSHFLMLRDMRVLKTVGSRPFSPKSYENLPARLVRHAMILGLRALQQVAPPTVINAIQVPDFISAARRRGLHLVIKSVVSFGRAGLLAECLPEARFVVILRNPYGQIASRLRGEAARKLERRIRDRELPPLRRAREFGLTEAVLHGCPDVEYLAWEWAVLTQKTLDELEGRANVRVVHHRDLIADPVAQARELFAFAGLDWREETAAFITRSSTHQGEHGYFDVMRDLTKVEDGWRTQLSAEQQGMIANVVRRTPLAQRWPELFDTSSQAAERV
jgi:hypothetical protein